MMSFWQDRAPRERLLLTLAAIVALIALIIQFGLVPMLERREAAALNVVQSEGTLIRLQKLKDSAAAYRPAVAPRPLPEAIALAAQWATEMGMTFQQDASPPGQSRFVFASADSTSVFAWLERIENELNLSVVSAELASSERGLVQATIVFSESAAP
jgi:type II secretory pathway component PulM